MFRHMAILKFKPDAKRADIDAYFAAFPGLMASLPVIKAWDIGRNQGAGGETHVKKGSFAPNYDVGLMMDFEFERRLPQIRQVARTPGILCQILRPDPGRAGGGTVQKGLRLVLRGETNEASTGANLILRLYRKPEFQGPLVNFLSEL